MRRTAAALVVSLVMLFPLAARAATTTYYLSGGSIPVTSLATSPGSGYERLLQKSGDGYDESDPTKYQVFRAPANGLQLVGSPSLIIWVKMKDDNTEKTGRFEVFLMDCVGSNCSKLDGELAELVPGGPWMEATLRFDGINHAFQTGHDIALKIVVENESDDDMMFAWGGSHPSHILANTPGTTTTSTTTTVASTTTTTAPMTTTTTAQSAAPTTTEPAPQGPVGTEPGIDPVNTDDGSTRTTSPSAPAEGNDSIGLAGSTTGAIVQAVGLDTDKSNLVVKTTPAQRGVAVASSLELSPVEGLMVSFVTAVESIQSQFVSAALLGLLMATLLILGLSRRNDDIEPSG